MKTKAIVFSAKENVLIQDLDVPPPGKQQIQVQSAYSGISVGTEGWMLRDLFTRVQLPWPCVPGYQRSGVVTAVGSEVTGWRVGDRAMALGGLWSNPEVTPAFGAHVEIANVTTDFAYSLSNQVDDVDASSAVVAQVGYNAAQRAPFRAGDWMLVYGDGLVGQCAAQAARARGARVILLGHRKERLELALQYSADAVLNSAAQDVVAAVRNAVGAKTVPVVLDTIQTEESQKQYTQLLENGRGHIVYCGFAPGTHWADMAQLQESELTTHFVNGITRERMDATLGLMASGKMRIRPLMTHFVPYTQGPEMYRMILEKNRPFLGITLDWRGNR